MLKKDLLLPDWTRSVRMLMCTMQVRLKIVTGNLFPTVAVCYLWQQRARICNQHKRKYIKSLKTSQKTDYSTVRISVIGRFKLKYKKKSRAGGAKHKR